MRVAWVTARHVQRVRVVGAILPPPFPDDSFFDGVDDCGFTEFKWGKWIAYVNTSISWLQGGVQTNFEWTVLVVCL